MSKLRDLLSKIAGDNGVELDQDELDELLGEDHEEETNIVDLADTLPGRAAGVIELFLAAPKETIEDGDLLWEPIAREGQWAMRPDGKGGKKRVPLKIVAGRSKNQRREIGLQDVVDSFNDGAVEHVTVPTTHENKATENNGYIKGLKILAGKFDGKPVKFLMGGYEITEPDVKARMKRGSIPSRSAGFLYDYERTDTGKKYSVALEHVALTPRPWLRGMPLFGRKLEACSDLEIATLTLSDEGPSEDEYALVLSDPAPDEDFLATTANLVWPQEESPAWLMGQVNMILDAKRAEQRAKTNTSPMYVEEYSPVHYRCKEAKPGQALICDSWGEGANHWIAPITVKDGQVELADFTKWQSVDQAWVADSTDAPTDTDATLADHPAELPDPLQIAQALRHRRASKHSTNEPPRGGGNMADSTSTFQLSDEARTAIKAAEDRAAEAERKADLLSQTVDKLVGTANSNRADAFILKLKGMGLDEGHGFGGMLNEIHQAMLADDGGAAVQSDHFADDKNTTGELTLSETIERIFGALITAEGSTLKLGEIITPPTEQLDDDKKGPDGKPTKGDEEVDESNLSDAELLARQEKDHPGSMAAAGIKLADNSNGNGGS